MLSELRHQKSGAITIKIVRPYGRFGKAYRVGRGVYIVHVLSYAVILAALIVELRLVDTEGPTWKIVTIRVAACLMALAMQVAVRRARSQVEGPAPER